MTKTALFISPHLDDAVFSCGGTLAKMADENWRTILCTVFTKSFAKPKGFALACQLDKNLPADVDYMKLRRAEDARAAKILNAAEVLHLDFPEAPHRNYNSAAELFAGIKTGDAIWQNVAEQFRQLDEIYEPTIIFAPQGLGNHCDHLQTINAVLKVFALGKVKWYRDTPYAIRQPEAEVSNKLPTALTENWTDINAYLERKAQACAEYESQINFQFGGKSQLETKLKDFHKSEAHRLNVANCVVETFLAADRSADN